MGSCLLDLLPHGRCTWRTQYSKSWMPFQDNSFERCAQHDHLDTQVSRSYMMAEIKVQILKYTWEPLFMEWWRNVPKVRIILKHILILNPKIFWKIFVVELNWLKILAVSIWKTILYRCFGLAATCSKYFEFRSSLSWSFYEFTNLTFYNNV